MTPPATETRKRKLRTLALGAVGGLLVGAVALLAQDLADRAVGAGDPPLRRSVRRAVTSTAAYDEALALARTSNPVKAAIGGSILADLTQWTVSDEASATRLRLVARLEGDAAEGELVADAIYARTDPEPRWRLERARFTPDAGAPIDLMAGVDR